MYEWKEETPCHYNTRVLGPLKYDSDPQVLRFASTSNHRPHSFLHVASGWYGRCGNEGVIQCWLVVVVESPSPLWTTYDVTMTTRRQRRRTKKLQQLSCLFYGPIVRILICHNG